MLNDPADPSNVLVVNVLIWALSVTRLGRAKVLVASVLNSALVPVNVLI